MWVLRCRFVLQTFNANEFASCATPTIAGDNVEVAGLSAAVPW